LFNNTKFLLIFLALSIENIHYPVLPILTFFKLLILNLKPNKKQVNIIGKSHFCLPVLSCSYIWATGGTIRAWANEYTPWEFWII